MTDEKTTRVLKDIEPTEGEIAYAGAQLRVAIVSLKFLKGHMRTDVERRVAQEAINTVENHYAHVMRGEM